MISVPVGDGENPSPLGEEKHIYCRYAALWTWAPYEDRLEGSPDLDSESPETGSDRAGYQVEG